MKKKSVEKLIDELEKQTGRVVNVVMDLKKKEKKWDERKAEIERRVEDLLGRVENLSDEKSG